MRCRGGDAAPLDPEPEPEPEVSEPMRLTEAKSSWRRLLRYRREFSLSDVSGVSVPCLYHCKEDLPLTGQGQSSRTLTISSIVNGINSRRAVTAYARFAPTMLTPA